MAQTPVKPVPTGPMATQPVITITAITSLASALIAGLAMIVNLPPDTEKVVLGILTAAYPIVTAAWTWHKVYSPHTAQKIANDAAVTGVAADTNPPPASKEPTPITRSETGVERVARERAERAAQSPESAATS